MLKKIIQLSLLWGLILSNKSMAQAQEGECIKPPTVLPDHTLFLVDNEGCIHKTLLLNKDINEDSQVININEITVDVYDTRAYTGSWKIFSL